MNNYNNRAELLKMVQKYLSAKAAPEEIKFLESYYDFFDRDENVLDHMPTAEKEQLGQQIEAGILERIAQAEQTKVRPLWSPFTRVAAAAVLLIGLSIGGYLALHKRAQPQIAENKVHDIAPGSNKAVLTLANGKAIILTGAKNGLLAQQGNTAVNKTADGQVVYSKSGTGKPQSEIPNPTSEIEYNTMTTPRGGQYHLTLADGTNVWLNAASSIKYPTSFPGAERRVEITGEAYFEVAHNAAKPFRVFSKGQTVEVLGTHFNISAYDDEPNTKTTLLEGSVRITADAQKAILKPGQQSQTGRAAGSIKIIENADTDQAIAWKNGYFQFDAESLGDIMRKAARWYDVDVVYTNKNLEGQLFSGTVSRFKNVSQLLKKLELTGAVHFKIEGQKIIVNN